MILPMTVLACLAIFVGYINTPWFGTFLGDWLTNGHGHEVGADLDHDCCDCTVSFRNLLSMAYLW